MRSRLDVIPTKIHVRQLKYQGVQKTGNIMIAANENQSIEFWTYSPISLLLALPGPTKMQLGFVLSPWSLTEPTSARFGFDSESLGLVNKSSP